MVAPRRLKYREALFLITLYVHGQAPTRITYETFGLKVFHKNLERLAEMGLIKFSGDAVVFGDRSPPYYASLYEITGQGRNLIEKILRVRNQESKAIIAMP
jgi:hypothetical protein